VVDDLILLDSRDHTKGNAYQETVEDGTNWHFEAGRQEVF
jgi:hypothetical protein